MSLINFSEIDLLKKLNLQNEWLLQTYSEDSISIVKATNQITGYVAYYQQFTSADNVATWEQIAPQTATWLMNPNRIMNPSTPQEWIKAAQQANEKINDPDSLGSFFKGELNLK